MRNTIIFVVALSLIAFLVGCPNGPGSTPQATLYSITYDANGATTGTAPVDSTMYEAGATVAVLGAGSLAKSGYSFSGWNTAADGSGTSHGASTTFSMPESNLTLFAVWTVLPTYTVTYDENGSTGGTVPVDGSTYHAGATVTVATNSGSLAKTDHTFAGWNRQPDASGTQHNAGSTFTMGSANVTLYAWWSNNTLATLDYTDIVAVPGGVFTQSDGTESFSHTVSSFEIGKYEVRYDLWYDVLQWALLRGYTFENAGREGNDGTDGAAPTGSRYEPVTFVSWRDSVVWCNAYSEMTGYSPVYLNDVGSVIRDSSDANAAEVDAAVAAWSANGFRLPTEGEWQYAASYIDGSSWLPYNHASGDETSYCYPANGGASSVVDSYAVFNAASTVWVGSLTENALGIHDMSGNVYEWCWDWDDSYPAGPETDYRGAAPATQRISRGGGFSDNEYNLRVGSRPSLTPQFTIATAGLRVARTP